MAERVEQVAREIVGRLEQAWNAGDGDAWAAEFADDADFITVRGEFFRTRTTIAEGHHHIFSTIYKGSTNRIALIRARPIGDDVILAHSSAELAVPAGPMAGTHRAIQSLLIVRMDDAWRIASFHNTFTSEESLGQILGVDRWQNHAPR
jgi:uncharacterized protein (TIGR02246 family)